MAEPIGLKYRALISYSHTDTSWAKWLHGKLEGFPIDKDLVGRETATGAIPKARQKAPNPAQGWALRSSPDFAPGGNRRTRSRPANGGIANENDATCELCSVLMNRTPLSLGIVIPPKRRVGPYFSIGQRLRPFGRDVVERRQSGCDGEVQVAR